MAPRKYANEHEMRAEMNRRIRQRERDERDAFRAAVAAKSAHLTRRATEPDPAVVLYRETKALWAEKGRVLTGTSGRHPLISTERQRGPRMLLAGAL